MEIPLDLACAAALAQVSRTSLGAGCQSGGPCKLGHAMMDELLAYNRIKGLPKPVFY